MVKKEKVEIGETEYIEQKSGKVILVPRCPSCNCNDKISFGKEIRCLNCDKILTKDSIIYKSVK